MVLSLVIPAHNEQRGLPRLLGALAAPNGAEQLDIVVVANGCSDATAEVARRFGVLVIETPVPSKPKALALGDKALAAFPRIYVDADVVLTYDDAVALGAALKDGIHAAGPIRAIPMAGTSILVRWWYQVWQQLPGVQQELYGRGVIAVDEEGHARLNGFQDWPEVVSDDVHISMSFAVNERVVAPDASVVIHPPKTYRDLFRRRTRAITANAHLSDVPSGPRVRGSGASAGFFMRLLKQHPTLAPAVVTFVATAFLSRLRGAVELRRGTTVWHRDESSRS